MSLRKSPTLTPARREANRRNAQKSTGPRTSRGQGQSRMNSLRTGVRSRFMRNLYLSLLNTPPCSVDRAAQTVLTPELAAHPLFADTVEMFREVEVEVLLQQRELWGSAAPPKSVEDGGARQRLAGAEDVPSAGPSAVQPTEYKEYCSRNYERSLNVIESKCDNFRLARILLKTNEVSVNARMSMKTQEIVP